MNHYQTLELWREASAISPHYWTLFRRNARNIKPERDLFFVKHKDKMLTKNKKVGRWQLLAYQQDGMRTKWDGMIGHKSEEE
jgi:hypothetical protein